MREKVKKYAINLWAIVVASLMVIGKVLSSTIRVAYRLVVLIAAIFFIKNLGRKRRYDRPERHFSFAYRRDFICSCPDRTLVCL